MFQPRQELPHGKNCQGTPVSPFSLKVYPYPLKITTEIHWNLKENNNEEKNDCEEKRERVNHTSMLHVGQNFLIFFFVHLVLLNLGFLWQDLFIFAAQTSFFCT